MFLVVFLVHLTLADTFFFYIQSRIQFPLKRQDRHVTVSILKKYYLRKNFNKMHDVWMG